MATHRRDKIEPAIVHRPTDSGVDLPPGRRADELAEEDYRAVEMDEPGEATEDAIQDDEGAGGETG
jgi:hypothetical protein